MEEVGNSIFRLGDTSASAVAEAVAAAPSPSDESCHETDILSPDDILRINFAREGGWSGVLSPFFVLGDEFALRLPGFPIDQSRDFNPRRSPLSFLELSTLFRVGVSVTFATLSVGESVGGEFRLSFLYNAGLPALSGVSKESASPSIANKSELEVETARRSNSFRVSSDI